VGRTFRNRKLAEEDFMVTERKVAKLPDAQPVDMEEIFED
jgi:hypothetical protein